MGRKNEENRKAHKKKLDQKRKSKSNATQKRNEKLRLIMKVHNAKV